MEPNSLFIVPIIFSCASGERPKKDLVRAASSIELKAASASAFVADSSPSPWATQSIAAMIRPIQPQ